ncbi:MAG: hypothetical protein ACLU4N_13745 [Butyricimonas faecihominis]
MLNRVLSIQTDLRVYGRDYRDQGTTTGGRIKENHDPGVVQDDNSWLYRVTVVRRNSWGPRYEYLAVEFTG